jgi:hypothetical protein
MEHSSNDIRHKSTVLVESTPLSSCKLNDKFKNNSKCYFEFLLLLFKEIFK